MTSCTSAALAPKPVVIDGRATLTMKKSSGARKAPVRSTASAAQRFGSGSAASVGTVAARVDMMGPSLFMERSVPNWAESGEDSEGLIDDLGRVLLAGTGLAQDAQPLDRAE